MQRISVILPIYNEAQSLPILFEALEETLARYDYEVIAVNDGSKDNTMAVLAEIAAKNARVRVINFVKNYGQTAAINAGIQHAEGDILVPMDSDLENDPADVHKLVEKLEEGWDVVSGWRQERWKGQYLKRELPSKLANRLISKISNVHLHDYGCTLKAYRREVIQSVLLYGEMHRFIPVYAFWQGADVTEVPVNYRPRRFGQGNYGLGRTFRVLLDLVLIRFFDRFLGRPIHFFGGLGFLFFALGGFSVVLSIALWLIWSIGVMESPWFITGIVSAALGINLVLLGVMAELLMRTYYESQRKMPYTIKSKLNFGES